MTDKDFISYGQHRDDIRAADVIIAGDVLIWGEAILNEYLPSLAASGGISDKELQKEVKVLQLGPLTPEDIERVRRLKTLQNN